ncbi:MAG: RHS repeat-associated core domain-containing protein [Caldilinea sp.]|nr:RHS repeat-associated core domain-containing protein [Caldilinea sp.]
MSFTIGCRPTLGQFLSPDTIVPAAGNALDYHRYAYTRFNPVRYEDDSGHCATLANGAADLEGDAECWQLAYSIFGFGQSLAERFAADWKVSPEEWLTNVASQSFADAGYLRPFAEQYRTDWSRQAGLPIDPVQWHQPPDQSLTFPGCDIWDCPALMLDTGSLILSAVGDAAWLGCTVATEGGCLVAVGLIKGADIIVTLASFGYSVNQYYSSDSASDLDLVVALTDLSASVLPGFGETSGYLSLTWDMSRPWIPAEEWVPRGAAE